MLLELPHCRISTDADPYKERRKHSLNESVTNLAELGLIFLLKTILYAVPHTSTKYVIVYFVKPWFHVP